jgi:hypothetical protein
LKLILSLSVDGRSRTCAGFSASGRARGGRAHPDERLVRDLEELRARVDAVYRGVREAAALHARLVRRHDGRERVGEGRCLAFLRASCPLTLTRGRTLKMGVSGT